MCEGRRGALAIMLFWLPIVDAETVSLPPAIGLAYSVDSFKSKLKICLFAKTYLAYYLFVRNPCSGMATL